MLKPAVIARKLRGCDHAILGTKFGRLTPLEQVASYVSPKGRKKRKFLCLCDCGNKVEVAGEALLQGRTKSCSCFRVETTIAGNTRHGHSRDREPHHPIYSIWAGIRARCADPTNPLYGGRGITLCERWNDFRNFLSDVGERPSEDHSIDRIDNDGPYSPENCRWATPKEQARNRRTNRFYEWAGTRMCLLDWCKATGMNVRTVSGRLEAGWAFETAISTPPGCLPC